MNDTLDVRQPLGARWWARLPLGFLALAGLVILARRPASPPIGDPGIGSDKTRDKKHSKRSCS